MNKEIKPLCVGKEKCAEYLELEAEIVELKRRIGIMPESWYTQKGLDAHCELRDRNIKYLQAENKRLKEALEWLKTDMSYKAPEQVFDMIYRRWIPYIEQALKGEVE